MTTMHDWKKYLGGRLLGTDFLTGGYRHEFKLLEQHWDEEVAKEHPYAIL